MDIIYFNSRLGNVIYIVETSSPLRCFIKGLSSCLLLKVAKVTVEMRTSSSLPPQGPVLQVTPGGQGSDLPGPSQISLLAVCVVIRYATTRYTGLTLNPQCRSRDYIQLSSH